MFDNEGGARGAPPYSIGPRMDGVMDRPGPLQSGCTEAVSSTHTADDLELPYFGWPKCRQSYQRGVLPPAAGVQLHQQPAGNPCCCCLASAAAAQPSSSWRHHPQPSPGLTGVPAPAQTTALVLEASLTVIRCLVGPCVKEWQLPLQHLHITNERMSQRPLSTPHTLQPTDTTIN